MSKKQTSKKGLPLTTTYLCLVVALVIASGTFAVQHLIEAHESAKETNPQQETIHEEAQGTTFDPALVTDGSGYLTPVVATGQHWPDVSTIGINGEGNFDYCILTGAVEPTNPVDVAITYDNSIRMPKYVCEWLAAQVFKLYETGVIEIQELLILPPDLKKRIEGYKNE